MKRHSLDPASLIAGLVFIALGIMVAAGNLELAEYGVGWLVPIGLVALGLLVLVSVKKTPEEPLSAKVPDEMPEATDDQASV